MIKLFIFDIIVLNWVVGFGIGIGWGVVRGAGLYVGGGVLEVKPRPLQMAV